jgi:hypothetical protein
MIEANDTVLLFGDSHSNTGYVYDMLARASARGITRVIGLGDFGIWPGPSGAKFRSKIDRRSAQLGITLYGISGNHDDATQIARFEAKNPRDEDGMVVLGTGLRWISRGHRWQWSGATFGSLGGAFSIDWEHRTPGEDWWPDAEEVQKADVEKLGTDRLDVLLCHDAPAGATPNAWLDGWPKNDEQSRVSQHRLRSAVEATRPNLVLHGHWHLRHSSMLRLNSAEHAVRVEGLASDQEHDGGSWGVLDLGDLSFEDGDSA